MTKKQVNNSLAGLAVALVVASSDECELLSALAPVFALGALPVAKKS
jgi:hypothetical protein